MKKLSLSILLLPAFLGAGGPPPMGEWEWDQLHERKVTVIRAPAGCLVYYDEYIAQTPETKQKKEEAPPSLKSNDQNKYRSIQEKLSETNK